MPTKVYDEPDFAFPPRPDRVGEKSIKVTTGSALLTRKRGPRMQSNGNFPKNRQIRKGRA